MVFSIFLFYGFLAPFAAGLGYLWIDMVTPQRLAYSLINGQPISQIMAITTIGLYLVLDRKHPPGPSFLHVLLLIWAVWVTLTTTWAEVPENAWIKWDWAFKSIVFAIFLPFLFRTRVQIEAFFLIVIFSASCFFLAAGAKTALGSGGYQVLGGLIQGNMGLAESSTMALVSVMLIPVILHLTKHSLIFKPGLRTNLIFYTLSIAVILAVVGTFARTGLIALGALAIMTLMLLKNRVKYLSGIAAIASLLLIFAPQQWQDRMLTTVNYQEDSSATGRLAVWKWAYEYTKENPLGGGFEVYRINSITITTQRSEASNLSFSEQLRLRQQSGKALHSIYFEVLAEHGFIGLAIYLAILATTLLRLSTIRRGRPGESPSPWQRSLATAMMMSIGVFVTAGAFVGIAFQPFLYYFVAMTIALHQYCLRTSDS